MENKKALKICPVCEEVNKCGMEEGVETCWCFSVVFSDALKTKLEKDFSNQPCICRSCFEQMNEEKED